MSRETCARKLTFFPLTEEGTYGQPIQLKWCVSLTTKDNFSEKESKADGTIEESSKIAEATDLTIELSSALPVEILSKLTGLEYIKGMAIKTTDTKAAKGCFAYEIGKTGDDGVRRRALRNAYVTLEDRTNETDSEGGTYKFVGKAIADENGDIEYLLDEDEVTKGADAGVKAVWDGFFTTCPHRPTVTP